MKKLRIMALTAVTVVALISEPVIITDTGYWGGHFYPDKVDVSSYNGGVWIQEGANLKSDTFTSFIFSPESFSPNVQVNGDNTVTCTLTGVPIVSTLTDTLNFKTSTEKILLYDKLTKQNAKGEAIRLAWGTGATYPDDGHFIGNIIVEVNNEDILISSKDWANVAFFYSTLSYFSSDPNASQVYGAMALSADMQARILADLALLDTIEYPYDYTNTVFGTGLGDNDPWELWAEYEYDWYSRYELVYEDSDHDGLELDEHNTKRIISHIKKRSYPETPRYSLISNHQ